MGGPCPDKTSESLYRVMTCGLSGNDGPLDLGEVMDPALDQLREPVINKDDLKAIIEFILTIPEPITVDQHQTKRVKHQMLATFSANNLSGIDRHDFRVFDLKDATVEDYQKKMGKTSHESEAHTEKMHKENKHKAAQVHGNQFYFQAVIKENAFEEMKRWLTSEEHKVTKDHEKSRFNLEGQNAVDIKIINAYTQREVLRNKEIEKTAKTMFRYL